MKLKWRLSSKAIERITPSYGQTTVVRIELPRHHCRMICRQQGWVKGGFDIYRHPITNALMADVYRSHTFFYSR